MFPQKHIISYDLDLHMAPEALHSLHAPAANVPLHMDTDAALHFCAAFGLIEQANGIVAKSGVKLTDIDLRGRSPLGTAIIHAQWSFLVALNKTAPGSVAVQPEDKHTIAYMRKKAYQDDVAFFSRLCKCGVTFPIVTVFSGSFVNSSCELNAINEYFLASNQRVGKFRDSKMGYYLIHYALMYGSRAGTRSLLNQQSVQYDRPDNINKETPLHLAFNTAIGNTTKNYEINDDDVLQLEGDFRSQHEKSHARWACGSMILKKHPHLTVPNAAGFSAYDLLLRDYSAACENMQHTYTDDRDPDYRDAKESFLVTGRLVEQCKSRTVPLRNTFAVKRFITVGLPYMAWLVLLIVIAFGHSTQNNPHDYFFQAAISKQFSLDDSFSSISTHAEMWAYLEGDFLGGLHALGLDKYGERDHSISGYSDLARTARHVVEVADTNSTSSSSSSDDGGDDDDPGVFPSGLVLVGAALIRQGRTSPTSTCALPPRLKLDQSDVHCFPSHYTPYKGEEGAAGGATGAGGAFQWSDPGSPFLSPYDNFFPSGGFSLVLDTASNTSVQMQTLEDLKARAWIDDYTRYVVVSFSVFNVNMNLMAAVVLNVEFSPSGNHTFFCPFFLSFFSSYFLSFFLL
eukprot:TRINITY_DN1186_c1_g1_i2.p2 TRINITY_DN1186_c1_g1~~TRINITY_DN1186_c1_g1_i2.p2  ORF type:complete len:626 (+),score=144.65 TRINITY_DN1186_c1_g1_i2:2191-4068(+)